MRIVVRPFDPLLPTEIQCHDPPADPALRNATVGVWYRCARLSTIVLDEKYITLVTRIWGFFRSFY